VVEKTLEELLDFELIPFKKAIAARVPAIMTAHILYPLVEKGGLPATFSRTFLSGLLREQLGFEGLIFTDALDMRAITNRYGLGKACIAAVQAGVDVGLSFSMALEEQRAAFEEVVAAAEAGQFDLTEIDASLARLEKWRRQYCTIPDEPEPEKEDAQIIAQAARQSITVVRSENGFLPLKNGQTKRPLLVDFKLEMESPVEEGRQPGPILEEQLRLALPTIQHLEIPAEPSEIEAEKVRALASQSDALIVVARNALRFENQARLVRQLIAERSSQIPLVVVVAREPYDLPLFENAPVVIATYGDPPATMKALASLLTEE
jgi:beta-N-acetylhexosaminidase